MTIDKPSRVLFLLLVATVLYLTLSPHPPQVALDTIPYGDKIEHFTAFAALALMARLGFPRVADWHLLEHLSFLGAMIEVVQATPACNATATGTTGSPTALARWPCWWRCGCSCAGGGRARR
jgi:hypothetical protein